MTDNPAPLYCANHPKVETTLRCNNCEKPICPKCAVLTPTGYRCKECVRGQQKVFETSQWYDTLVAFVIASILSFAGSWLATLLGFLSIFIAPIAGGIIAEAVRFAVRKRRSRNLFLITGAAVALGSLPLLLFSLVGALIGSRYSGGAGIFGPFLGLILQGVYTVLATTTAYYRLSGGIRFK